MAIKSISSLILLLSMYLGGFSQVLWDKTIGSPMGDGIGTAFVFEDNIYLFSSTRGNIGGDKTIPARDNSYDGWISVLDENRNLVNQTVLGGAGFDVIDNAIRLPDGNLLVAISSNSDIGFDRTVPLQALSFGDDIWLVKIDPDLNIIWQRSYGQKFDNEMGLVSDSSGFIYLAMASSYRGIGATNRTVPSKGLRDIWLLKLDEFGNEIWQTSIGGDSIETDPILVLAGNNLFLACLSNSGESLDKNSANFGMQDVWITKLDTSGTILNQATFGSAEDEIGIGMETDGNNNPWLIIPTLQGVSGNKTENGFGEYDAWILKLNDTLGVDREFVLGGVKSEWRSSAFYSSKKNNMIFDISSESGASGNKTVPNNGASDRWLVETDLDGTILNQYGAGGDGYDQSSGVFEFQNTLVSFGSSSSTVSGDKTEPNKGGGDNWLVAFDIALTSSNLAHKSFPLTVFPNPAQSSLNVKGLLLPTAYQIYSVTGKLISTGVTQSEISISNFESGLYFIQFSGHQPIRLVKK